MAEREGLGDVPLFADHSLATHAGPRERSMPVPAAALEVSERTLWHTLRRHGLA